jgi:hypothetical protein
MITFRCAFTQTNEQFQMSFKTGKRGLSADQQSLLAALHTSFNTNVKPYLESTVLTAITYSEWGTAGFTGFHQVLALPVSESSPVTGPLPPQCALVVSLRTDGDLTIPLRRRRGRLYHGLLPSSKLTGTGQVTSTYANQVRDGWKAMGTTAKTIPSDGSACDGLGVVSVVGGTINNATVIGVGLAVDTQRRRRQKEVENIAYVAT